MGMVIHVSHRERNMKERRTMTKAEKAAAITDAMEMLNKFLKPGSKVYTVVRSVAKSGMSRTIDLYTIHEGEMMYLSGYAATVLDYRRTDQGALKVSGCGMDMCFHIVYSLSRKMFPNGFVPADAGRHGRNGSDPKAVDTDGGYALRQEHL
jgi:hypothetical protein